MHEKERFIVELYPAAHRASLETDLSVEFILAQAVRESDWGRSMPPGSHNIFNLRADADWAGPTQAQDEIQIVDGRIATGSRMFRVYASFDDALRDHLRSLRENPGVADAGLFEEGVRGDLRREVQALQRAGYATDSQYAEQLIAIAHGPTMARGLQMAARMPLVTDPAHPCHGLYEVLSRQLPDGTPSQVVAGVVLQAMANGIRTPAQVRGVALEGDVVHVQGEHPGVRLSVDLKAPMPTLQESSAQLSLHPPELQATASRQEPSPKLG